MPTPNPSWHALLHLLLLLPPLSTAQPRPNTTMEIDLLSPLANSVHRVSPTRGLAVLIGIQNRHLGDPAAWAFEWTASRLARPRFFVSAAVTSSGTNAWGAPTHSLDQGHGAGGVELVLSHPRLEAGTDKPSKGTMPPGEYEFTWSVQIGAWCEVSTPPQARSREYSANHYVSRGKFNFTVVEDGVWPVLTRTAPEGGGCASVAGQVSFAAYSTMVPGWNTRYDAPFGPCAVTASVTEEAAPCRVTVDGEVAGRVAGIMGWDGGPTGVPSAGGRFGGWGWWGVVVGLSLLVGVW